jgi:hypothetical protein
MEIICDFINQVLLNKSAKLHCVSYELNNHIVNVNLIFFKNSSLIKNLFDFKVIFEKTC